MDNIISCPSPGAHRKIATSLFTAFIAAISFTLVAAPAQAKSPDVLRATLANGLRVVIVRNTLAPVVSTSVNYLVGADETPPGFPGMAHAQEHMMFRGSPGLSADQLADIGSVMGGNFNADTRQTVTQYLYTVPSSDLDLALHIEAVRMRGVLDSKKGWKEERGAIEQEVAQDMSNPEYVMSDKLRTVLFKGTPYAHDALGTRPSFDATTAAMLKHFHDLWYAPNNAILAIVGDLDPKATLHEVKKLFSTIPAKKLPARPKINLRPVAPRSLHFNSDRPYGLQVITLRLPGLDSPDYAATEILVDVLNSQRSALYSLVPQGKALGTAFSIESMPKSSMVYAVAAFPKGGNAKSLDSEMRAILKRIAKHGVSPDLVAAAKLQERSGLEFQKNSISGLATVWSEAVAVDGQRSPEEELDRLEKVSTADVDRVARKYLDLKHAVSAVLTPRGSGKPVASHGFGGQESINLGSGRPTKLPAWATAAMGRLAVPKSTLHPVVSKLPNGITLIVQPEKVSNTVSLYGHIRNRPKLQVPKGKDGLSEVLDQLFDYGSQHLGRIAFQKALDDIGATEQAGTNFSLQTLTDHFDRGVQLLADNELRPALPEKAFHIVRRQVSETVAGRLTSPGYLSHRALRTALFPKDDPTLRQALPKTVDSIRMKDLKEYYRAAFRPDLTTIVVIGDITPAHAKKVIEKYFGTWKATGPKPNTDLPKVPLSASSSSAVPDASRVQDRVTLAETLGLTRLNPDYYALELGNNVLGGAFYSTRLTRDIRKNAGLVYYIQSDLELSKTRGIYLVSYACDPQNVSKVRRMVEDEIRRMQKAPVSADELQRAKALLLHQIPLGESDFDSIAHSFLHNELLGLPLDEPTHAAHRYLGLDAQQVQRAFDKWLRPKALARVSQGPTPK